MQPGRAISSGLLSHMGLGHGAVRNIIMHRDIVPRAFACDYTLVSDLLARVSDSFRNHTCLHSEYRKVRLAAACLIDMIEPWIGNIWRTTVQHDEACTILGVNQQSVILERLLLYKLPMDMLGSGRLPGSAATMQGSQAEAVGGRR